MEPTPALRDKLRRKLGEEAVDGGSESETMFTNEQLDDLLRDNPTMNHAIVEGWEDKISAWSNLVDVVDGAASRKFGTLVEHAEARIKYYKGLIASGPGQRAGRSRVGKIIRRG